MRGFQVEFAGVRDVNPVGRPGFRGVARGIAPGFHRVAHAQPVVVAFEQLEYGKIRFRSHVRKRIHMELEIKRVAGLVIPLHLAAQNIHPFAGVRERLARPGRSTKSWRAPESP